METSPNAKPGFHGYIWLFLLLAGGFVMLDRFVDYFGLLGYHRPLLRSAVAGALWAALMVSVFARFSGARTSQ